MTDINSLLCLRCTLYNFSDFIKTSKKMFCIQLRCLQLKSAGNGDALKKSFREHFTFEKAMGISIQKTRERKSKKIEKRKIFPGSTTLFSREYLDHHQEFLQEELFSQECQEDNTDPFSSFSSPLGTNRHTLYIRLSVISNAQLWPSDSLTLSSCSKITSHKNRKRQSIVFFPSPEWPIPSQLLGGRYEVLCLEFGKFSVRLLNVF